MIACALLVEPVGTSLSEWRVSCACGWVAGPFPRPSAGVVAWIEHDEDVKAATETRTA